MVISMSLSSHDPDHVYGAIRNAQLAPVVFPGWTVRIYVPAKKGIIPERVLRKLSSLGTDIMPVSNPQLPPRFWNLLVSADPVVKRYLVRDPTFRLSTREFVAAQEWLGSKKRMHCVRDLAGHINQPIVEDLWGMEANSKENEYIVRFLEQFKTGMRPVWYGIKTLYPVLRHSLFCHDSVSCGRWPDAVNFTLETSDGDIRIGQRFNSANEPLEPLAKQPNCYMKLRYEDFS